MLGYHPSVAEILTRGVTTLRTLSGRRFDWGGRLRKSNGGAQSSLRPDRNRPKSAKAEGSLTARPTSRAGTKVGLSDPVVLGGKAIAQRIKSYPGDNRLISPKSSYRRGRFGTSMSAHHILGLE